MDRPWSDVSSTEIGNVGANEISRDDMNVIHIFCIFSRKFLLFIYPRFSFKSANKISEKETNLYKLNGFIHQIFLPLNAILVIYVIIQILEKFFETNKNF